MSGSGIRRTPPLAPALCLAVTVTLAVGGCGSDPDPASSGSAPSPSSSVRTLAPLRVTRPPATGELSADLRQSSRDAALGRMQVWIRNDRESDLLPTRVTYSDDRLTAPLTGGRLRVIPARSFRGYTLTLPRLPDCGATAASGSGTVVVEHGDERESLPVEDEADVVQRFQDTRCFEVTVAKVADLSWSDDVPVDHPGEGGIGTLVLQVRPRGGDGSLTVDSVAGTPLLSSYRTPVWTPDLTVRGTDEPTSVDLPVHPARCDEHAFMEAAGGTALRVKLTVRLGAGEEPESGELILRMSPEGAAHAIQYVRDSCGY